MPIWSGSGMRGGLCPMVVDSITAKQSNA